MKEEFKRHGFEVRNEFEFGGARYYDAVKDGLKLSVEEGAFGALSIHFRNKGVWLPKEMANWERLCDALVEHFEQRIEMDGKRMVKALADSEKRRATYKKLKEMFRKGANQR